ncbi:MAG: pimeloyl-ACP methyl ester esterase BioH [Vicinamibacterales bacterium]
MSSDVHVESAGAGPPLVLLHGWAMHSGLWGPLVPQLAARFRVHAVDLPGHGRSSSVVPCTLDDVMAAVAARFDGESGRLTVVGWSLGGAVAMHWAKVEADRIGRLVLISTSPRFVAGDDWPHAMTAETLGRFGDELRVSYRHTMTRFLSLQLQGSDDGRAALAVLRRRFFERGEPAPAALADALAPLAALDLRAAVPAIAQPTLVIAGDRDTLVPLGAAQWLAATLPNARLATIAGAAHVPFLSHRSAFERALTGFLA